MFLGDSAVHIQCREGFGGRVAVLLLQTGVIDGVPNQPRWCACLQPPHRELQSEDSTDEQKEQHNAAQHASHTIAICGVVWCGMV